MKAEEYKRIEDSLDYMTEEQLVRLRNIANCKIASLKARAELDIQRCENRIDECKKKVMVLSDNEGEVAGAVDLQVSETPEVGSSDTDDGDSEETGISKDEVVEALKKVGVKSGKAYRWKKVEKAFEKTELFGSSSYELENALIFAKSSGLLTGGNGWWYFNG